MAIGIAVQLGCPTIDSGPTTYSTSCLGSWTTVNDDATVTQTAAEMNRPATITNTNLHWARVSGRGWRMLIRAKYRADVTAVTSGFVRVYGAFGNPNTSGAFADDGTINFMRLDAGTNNATGKAIALVLASGATLTRDTTFLYSDPTAGSLARVDALGSWYLTVMSSGVDATQFAASGSATSNAVALQVLFLN